MSSFIQFSLGPSTAEKELKEKNQRVAQLERKVGQLTYEVDWLKKNLKKLSKRIFDEDLFVMRRIDEVHTYHPTWGYRTITRILRRDDHLFINRKRARRIMRDMGIYTIYPKPNLSKRYHAKYIRPYLLRNLPIDHPD